MTLPGTGVLGKVSVHGVVQGVGFRPFVHRLAEAHNLKGWVRNTSGCVEIEAEGNLATLSEFLDNLNTQAPPMAHIEKIEATYHAARGYRQFVIRESLHRPGAYQPVSPDIATCPDCRQEILNPADRRYGYPFTNCTNCGPRFTIIKDIPYDRAATTMRRFTMCPRCREEYDDHRDRRFHAQPTACPECGPRLELVDAGGQPVASDDIIKTAANLLKSGNILAIKGLGGFQLACDATSSSTVDLLRTRKRRSPKPLAVMMTSITEISRHCLLSAAEKKLLESPQCPIVLLRWQRPPSDIVPEVAPNLKTLGVMLPCTPLHHLLLRETGLPLVMTSGNLSEEPIASDNEEAMKRLGGIADYFLMHDRGIFSPADDSVYFVEGKPRPVRRARGYAPAPVTLPFHSKQVLACGAEEKNTFCLARGEHAFLSQHIGDMENEATLQHFERSVELYKKLFRVVPEVIACDMHPEYLTTKYARKQGAELGLTLVPVQHHHAHVVSCMVENGVEEPVIGVAFDGTGYGPDGAIWGGEFLIADWHHFQRAGHLEYVSLPGGAAAIRKPCRMALSYLHSLLGEETALSGLPFTEGRTAELDIVRQQLRRGVNSPLTSSAGRLFDGVAALVGVRQQIDYPAQAAIELEMQAWDEEADFGPESYPFSIATGHATKEIRLGELFAAIIRDMGKGVSIPTISYKFHLTLAEMIAEMCRLIADETGVRQVALSGGVFQNRLLQKLAFRALKKDDFKVLTHHLVPCNDGGISLGQAVIANFATE